MGISTETEPQVSSEPSPSAEIGADEQTLGQYIPLLYHYNMLQDQDRVCAFREAIELLVRPEMHVVELGGGTGILSSFAARQGARVSCVERNPELVANARKFVGANGLGDQIDVIQADASQFVPAEPVDVVVCEMLHVGLLREKQVQVIDAFKRNYNSNFGPKLPVFIPEASVLMAQPIHQSFDFEGYIAPVPMFQTPLMDQPRTKELTDLSPYASIDYRDLIPTSFAIRQDLSISREGCLNALRFITQNVLAIDTQKQRAITWPNQCLVLPVEQPIQVNDRDRIEMQFKYAAGASIESLSESIQIHKLESPLNQG
ncbi:MAG: methyltransferase domain-containing protein [Rubripirellula sp.]